MNAIELRDLLDEQIANGNGEMEIVTTHSSGDYWRTVLAPGFTGIGQGRIKHSVYHGMDQLVRDDGEDEADVDADSREVLILE